MQVSDPTSHAEPCGPQDPADLAGTATSSPSPNPVAGAGAPPVPAASSAPRHLRVIACEIALREICHLAARSRNLLDLEFVSQGLHDHPARGRLEVQRRLDAVPPGVYDAILLGYGLCGRLLEGITARHTPLVVPRAHDCITFFLGSKERYQKAFFHRPGTYYFTSGWVECAQKRSRAGSGSALATPILSQGATLPNWEAWTRQHGESKARALMEVLREWTAHYTHGVLIEFDFTRSLGLAAQVRAICARQGWQFEEWEGDLGLLHRWLEGDWRPEEFLMVPPGHRIVATFDEDIVRAEPVTEPGADVTHGGAAAVGVSGSSATAQRREDQPATGGPAGF
ncbi:DUF1638 domain-containing protein [Limisphaera sp. VF-2]|jgi:hypothetical protein|uniref:DUF1638 domain-containing protein n=1 Tax=Limisphaera sp. VF-2 TaxID=3400418 RepID=UPI0017663FDC